MCSTSASGARRRVYFATFAAEARRRHHGHGEPQSAGLQRHEIRARGIAPDQRRHRAEGHGRAHRVAAACRRTGGQAAAPSARSTSARATSSTCWLRGSLEAAQAQSGRERRQRRRRPRGRPARAAPAVRVHQDESRAGRHLPERRAEPDARGEPSRHHATPSAAPAPTSASPGTATTTAASSSTSTGTFIEGYYLVGLLAEVFLKREPGARIVHDPRLTWNTIDIVRQHGGEPVLCKSGHAFIKAKMREVDGAYGGEMSAHHYFRDFSYCDSGMIPWLLVLQMMLRARQDALAAGGRAHAALPGERRDQPPSARRMRSRCSRRAQKLYESRR